MAKTSEKTRIKGGYVARNAKTGRFLSVETASGKSKASARSRTIVEEASSKREDALKRLADR